MSEVAPLSADDNSISGWVTSGDEADPGICTAEI